MGKYKYPLLFAALLALMLGIFSMSQNSVKAEIASVCTDPSGQNAQAAYVRGTETMVVAEDDSLVSCGTGHHVAFDQNGDLWTANGGTLLKNGTTIASGNTIVAIYSGDTTTVARNINFPKSVLVETYDLNGQLIKMIDATEPQAAISAVFSQKTLTGVLVAYSVSLAEGSELRVYNTTSQTFDISVSQIEGYQKNAVGTYDFLFLRGFVAPNGQGSFWRLNLSNMQLSQTNVPNYGAVWNSVTMPAAFSYVQIGSSYIRTFSPLSMQTSSAVTLSPFVSAPYTPQHASSHGLNAFLGFTYNYGLVKMANVNGFVQYKTLDTAIIADVSANPLFIQPEAPEYGVFLPMIVR